MKKLFKRKLLASFLICLILLISYAFPAMAATLTIDKLTCVKSGADLGEPNASTPNSDEVMLVIYDNNFPPKEKYSRYLGRMETGDVLNNVTGAIANINVGDEICLYDWDSNGVFEKIDSIIIDLVPSYAHDLFLEGLGSQYRLSYIVY
jgi:oligoribonuclease NrnB/cAMP/cGMP phosphodiesterase (DHH superfamily)